MVNENFINSKNTYNLCTGGVGGRSSLSANEIIAQFKNTHGDKYDYTKVYYINAKTKIEIICPIHGSFWQTPNDHKNGYGCLKCAIDKRKKI